MKQLLSPRIWHQADDSQLASHFKTWHKYDGTQHLYKIRCRVCSNELVTPEDNALMHWANGHIHTGRINLRAERRAERKNIQLRKA